ncbi:response regulator [Candidatus Avelusimicrobium aviculae]|uniref:response regulator n=1 Tax=Candidatus Avelusimicrobium aviculae TaxID=3416206 RepID=UPI003D0A3066
MPKQHIVLLLFLGAGLMTAVPPAGAQPNQVKQALKQTEKRAVKAAQKTAVAQQEAFEKILLNRAVSSWEKRQKQPSVSFEPTPPDKLATFIFPLNEVQKRRAKQYYYEAMRQFAELKKDLDIHLFYIQTQKDDLLPAQLAALDTRIFKVEEKLARAALVFHDGPLNEARNYLLDARQVLNPFSPAQTLQPPSYLRREDRTFVKKEFFLYGKDNSRPRLKSSRWLGSFRDVSRAKALAAHIPAHMRIAFINDRTYIGGALMSWYRKGLFPEGTDLFVYFRLQDIQRDLAAGKTFDLIITDLVMKDGGGYALVSELRQNNSTTTVIALSAYGEDEVRARELYDLGFDGMLSTHDGGFPVDATGCLTLLNGLKNYYFWKELHGWKR